MGGVREGDQIGDVEMGEAHDKAEDEGEEK